MTTSKILKPEQMTDEELITAWEKGVEWLLKAVERNDKKEQELVEAGMKRMERIEDELIKRGVKYG